MARDHARLFTSIWTDPDFVALSAAAQRCYMLLLSQPDLSYCGATGITIRRWANMSEGTTTADIQAALDELEAAGFIITDPDTEEVLVRSFMRNDGLLKSPNMAKAAVKAATVVLSEVLRAALAIEFDRILNDLPEKSRDDIQNVIDEGLPKGFGKGSAKGSGKGYRTPTPTPAPTPAPANPFAHAAARATEPDRFDEFWDAYPLKKDKAPAHKAWAKAVRIADPDVIIAAARAFRNDPNRRDGYTKYPATWLNAQAWENGPEPDRGTPSAASAQSSIRPDVRAALDAYAAKDSA